MIYNLDELKFKNGYPTRETIEKLYDQLNLQRAADAIAFPSRRAGTTPSACTSHAPKFSTDRGASRRSNQSIASVDEGAT